MNEQPIYLHSNRVFINGQLLPANILIKEGKILGIYPGEKMPGAEDHSPYVIMPGAIDAHVHINEPGRTEWEGFDSACKAAAKGGITSLVDMPLNSSPVVTTTKALEEKILATADKLHVDVGFWAGAVDGDVEKVAALLQKGCLGVKVFLSDSGLEEFPNISMDDLETLMSSIQKLNKPVLAHCEFDHLAASNKISITPRKYQAYLETRPKEWENEAIKAFVGLSEKHQCKAHIVHLASDEIVPWIDEKKQSKVPFTVETCPHYLMFYSEDIADGNTLFKCAPPIRDYSNRKGLVEAVRKGTIDFIASDHSPAPPDIKEIESGDFSKAWGGIAGLQFLLSASWTALKEEISLEQFIPLLTSRPAEFLGISRQVGILREGNTANITIWNPEGIFEVTPGSIEHRHKASPYSGLELSGTIIQTIVNGHVVYKEGEFVELNKGKTIKA